MNKQHLFRAIGFTLLLIVMNTSLMAQSEDNPISRLKESVLLVRLDMKTSKQEAYQEIIDNAKDDNKKSIYEEKLAELIKERDTYSENVIKAFERHYIFSDVYFIEGQDFREVLEGKNNSAFRKDKSQVTLPEDYLLLIKGDDDTHWILVEKDLSPLPNGIPSEFDLGIKKILDVLVGKDNFALENMEKVVKKIEKKLSKYYFKAKK